jgi:hypothetical protein
MDENGKRKALQIGLYVFVVLAVLTVGEFLIAAVGTPWWALFIFIALLKAYFVVINYMHLPRLFAEEEPHA